MTKRLLWTVGFPLVVIAAVLVAAWATMPPSVTDTFPVANRFTTVREDEVADRNRVTVFKDRATGICYMAVWSSSSGNYTNLVEVPCN